MKKDKFFVTGGEGFIGNNFVNYIIQDTNDIKPIVTDLPREKNPRFQLMDNDEIFYRAQDNEYDICEIPKIPVNVDYVVNFAAETHVDNSYVSCKPFIHANVDGVRHLLDLIRAKPEAERPVFIQISTDEVLGPTEEPVYHDAPYNPCNPYAASKAAAEMLIKSYAETYGIKYKIIRLTNCWGPFQHLEKLIPKTIERFSRGKPMTIHGNGEQKRSWLHVYDAVEEIHKISKYGIENMTFHIGSEYNQSVIDIVRTILKVMKKEGMDVPSEPVEFVEDRFSQDMNYRLRPFRAEISPQDEDKMLEVIDYVRNRI